MGMHLYWVSAITYAIVIGLLLLSDILATNKPNNLEKSYRVMSAWVVFFCLQDTLWGLCEAKVIKSDAIFFLSSSVFHLSTVITTFFWLKYVLDYLGNKIKGKKIYLGIDCLIILEELVFVIINIFKTTLFEIVDGNYVTGALRPLTFVNQYIVYVIIGLTALVLAIKKETKSTANYRTVFFFALAPILLGLCQLIFPDAPFYSLGYFLGCIIIHIFVVAHDREVYLSNEEKLQKIIELNNKIKHQQLAADEQFSILKSISGAFDYINMVDLESQTAYRFDVKDPKDSEVERFDIVNDPHTSLNKSLAVKVDERDLERFMEHTNLSTLDRKMRGKKIVSGEFKLADGEWIRAMYIRVGEEVNTPISKVAYALRNITSDRKREEQVYFALTNLVYSLHIFDLENDTMERLIESDIFKQIVGEETSAQRMSDTIIRATCKDEFLDAMLKFVDLSTVSQRLEGQSALTTEFVGKYHGWTRMTFIPIEMKNDQVKKMVIVTEIIDSEKNEVVNLLYKSSTDELTRLYNRRTYEEDLDSITENNDMEKLVIVAMDVNGLKTVNDTIGHKAGDELIIGASRCIDTSFVSVGKTYRTGGDEFMAILRCDKEELTDIFASFDKSIEEWSGNLVESLSISYGYVMAKDYPELAVRDLASEADKKMYEAKSEYYKKKGIERRRT